MKSIWWMPLAAVLALTGCGDSDEPGPDAGATPEYAASNDGENGLLAGVDAETAYLYANLRRLPEAVLDKFWAATEASSVGNQAMIDELEDDEELPPAARTLLREVLNLGTREGWEAAGLHPNPYYAFYGVDLLPFGQIELADADAFAALIARVEAELKPSLERRDVDGIEVIWIPLDRGLGVALAWDEDSLSAGLVPDEPAMLARVAGRYTPPDAFRPDTLAEFNRKRGFTAYGSGFVDWRRMVATLIGQRSPVEEIAGADAAAALRGDAACVAEYQALAASMPRLAFGYTRRTETHADLLLRQELDPALAAAIAPIAQAPVGIDRELKGLINFGLAFDLLAAREFARGLVDGWVETPPACMAFASIAANAPDWQQMLARPIPPLITNLHGVFVELSRLESNGDLPTGGGTLSVYMRNPQVLFGMAQMFAPALAAIPLQPGDPPQKLPSEALPQLEDSGLETWMAMGKSALGIAVGADNIDALSEAMKESEADDLFMTGRMDFDVLATLLEMAENTLDDLEATEALAAQRASYDALVAVYDQAGFKIRFGEQGIDLVFETRLR